MLALLPNPFDDVERRKLDIACIALLVHYICLKERLGYSWAVVHDIMVIVDGDRGSHIQGEQWM